MAANEAWRPVVLPMSMTECLGASIAVLVRRWRDLVPLWLAWLAIDVLIELGRPMLDEEGSISTAPIEVAVWAIICGAFVRKRRRNLALRGVLHARRSAHGNEALRPVAGGVSGNLGGVWSLVPNVLIVATTSFVYAVSVALYVDARCRTEDLEVEVLARRVEEAGARARSVANSDSV